MVARVTWMAAATLALVWPPTVRADWNPYAGLSADGMVRHVCQDAGDAAAPAAFDRIDGHLEALRAAEAAEIARLTTQDLGARFAGRLMGQIGHGSLTDPELEQVLEDQFQAVGRSLAEVETWIAVENLRAAMRRYNTVVTAIERTRRCLAEARAALITAGEAAASWDGFWASTSGNFFEAREETYGIRFYYQGRNDSGIRLSCSGEETLGDVFAQIGTAHYPDSPALAIRGPICVGNFDLPTGFLGGSMVLVRHQGPDGRPVLSGYYSEVSAPDDWMPVELRKLSAADAEAEGLVPYGQ